jgi:hypothetical protein
VIVRASICVLLLALTTGCAHVGSDEESIAALTRAALATIDQRGEMTLVFAPGIPRAMRNAFLRDRPSAKLSRRDQLRYLPNKVLRIDEVIIDGERATVKAWRGPVPRPLPGLLGCGTGFTVEFTLVDGIWKSGTILVTAC